MTRSAKTASLVWELLKLAWFTVAFLLMFAWVWTTDALTRRFGRRKPTPPATPAP